MTRSSCHDTQRKLLTPLPDDFAWNTPKRRLPGRERPDSRGFRHFFVYIAHFPQKSKLYGEINWYIRHSDALILGQVVNRQDLANGVRRTRPKRSDKSVAGSRIGGEILLLARHPLPGLRVGRRGLLG